jgi:hypothetical protein
MEYQTSSREHTKVKIWLKKQKAQYIMSQIYSKAASETVLKMKIHQNSIGNQHHPAAYKRL